MSSRISTRVRAENAPAPSFTRTPQADASAQMRVRRNSRYRRRMRRMPEETVAKKLAVNQPGDRFEQEADRMAEFVVHGGRQSAADAFQLLVRRHCSAKNPRRRRSPTTTTKRSARFSTR